MTKLSKMRSFKYYLFFALTMVFLRTHAQENATAPEQQGSLESGTIESQFDYLNSVSNNYQEYKVVRKAHLDRIKANITDSLRVFKDQIGTKDNQLTEQKSSIDQLNQELESTQAELQQALDMKDSFSFMGMYIEKSAYNSLVWGLVIILVLFLLYFIYRFKRNFAVTAELKQSLAEIREEFEQHRRNTLERERKLNRQLVDEMNKRKI